MSMKLSLYLGVVAVALGLIFLFMPIESAAAASCGNAFGGGDELSSCGAARGERWMLVLAMVGLGAAALFAALDSRSDQPRPADTAS